jgi:hypothetical protein
VVHSINYTRNINGPEMSIEVIEIW